MRTLGLQWLNPVWLSENVFTLYGGGKGGDMPDAPDYEKLAKLQTQSQIDLNRQSTRANRIDQFTPFGSLTYQRGGGNYNKAGYDAAMAKYNQDIAKFNAQSQGSNGPRVNAVQTNGNGASWFLDSNSGTGGGSGNFSLGAAPKKPAMTDFGYAPDQWSSKVELTPELQAILDENFGAQRDSYSQLQGALDKINSNDLPLAPVNAGETAQDAILRRVNPQLNIQEDQLRTRLINQGLRPGTEGWNRELDTMGRQRNDAVSQAALQGIGVGNEARARALQEQGIPINLINAYLGGSQVQMPQFQSYAQQATAQAPDLLGAAQSNYGNQVSQYNAQQAQSGGLMGGLFNLGANYLTGGGYGALSSALGGGVGGSTNAIAGAFYA